MSVAEFPNQGDGLRAQPDREGGGDRLPPQDVAAEQSVLGAMLLSKDAIADVVETLRADEFYRPAHQAIYDAITELFTKGQPADMVMVSDALGRTGDLGRIGGAAYLHTLVSSVPTAASASYYAEIVHDKSVLRKLVTAGTRIAQWGYAGEGDVDQIADRAQAEVFDATSSRAAEDYAPLSGIMDGAIAEIEGIAARGGQMVGVPTGFIDLDRLTNGLHAGQLIIVAARPAIGKALAVDTPIPTPGGWTTMGELTVGDRVLGQDGAAASVVAATEVMLGRPCYMVEFSDGSSIVADENHRWRVAIAGGESTHTTAQLHRHVQDLGRAPVLPEVAALTLEPRSLPVEPYSLGVWLAHSGRELPLEVQMHAEAHGLTLAEVAQAAHDQGITHHGYIPVDYLRAAEDQRRSLLAGLLDANAVVNPSGTLSFTTQSRPLAQGMHELLATLGISAEVSGHPPRNHRQAAEVRLTFTSDRSVFRRADQDLRHKELWDGVSTARPRTITAITPIPSVPVRCIEVDNPSHLFLAGRAMVPTHNSTLGLDVARSAAIKHGLATVLFSLEMSRNEIVMRLLSAEAQIPLHHMRSGKMHDPEWRKIASRQGALHEAPLFVDDSPNMTMTEIRAKCRRLRQREDLRLVIVDYMQLMTSGRKVESRQQEVSEFSRSLKLLAKELEVPVIAISQLNRGPEARNDKKPMLSDLRESGCLTEDTLVTRADTGAEVTLGELHRSGARDVPVWSLDDSLRYRARTMTHVFPTGTREVYELTTAAGRRLTLTANHKLLTYGGWRAAGDLAPGSRIAIPRHVPAPIEQAPADSDELILLGHLLGGGVFGKHRCVRYASANGANLEAVAGAAGRRFGAESVREGGQAGRATTLRLGARSRRSRDSRNPIADWLSGIGLLGLRRHQMCVPEHVFAATKEQVALFLRHLWAANGSIRVVPGRHAGSIHYAAPSRRLADDVSRLLLRFGLTTSIHLVHRPGSEPAYRVVISGAADQKVFLRRVGGFGPQAPAAAELLQTLDRPSPTTASDIVPREVWGHVRETLAATGVAHGGLPDTRGTRPYGSSTGNPASGREHLGRIARILHDSQSELIATNDVFWDEVVAIKPVGRRAVFDATVLGTHNFIADGVAVHNSLEQDADMVVLIHREDAYDKDSSRVGEADLIVAKHRNGPTDTVTVAFQGHYSRFVDMARE